MAFREHFQVQLKPSRIHFLLLASIHCAIALIALLPQLMWFPRLAVIVIAVVSYFWHRRDYRRISCFDYLDFNALGITLKSSKNELEVDSLIEKDLYLSSWLIIFSYRDNEDKKQSFLLFKDAVHADDFRHIYVLFKTKAYRFQEDNLDLDD